jgi:3D (Asp-Asp-Asp) domain-containing protein
MHVSATAYCTTGTTYAGTRARRGIVAADPDVLPIGTVVRVDGLPKGFNRTHRVEDTGRAIKGREIDVFTPDCKVARWFGRREARVQIVRWPPGERSSR